MVGGPESRETTYAAQDTWHVVFDTNGLTLRGTQGDFDFWLTDSEMRRLLEGAPREIYHLCVPHVVVLEMANHYRERLRDANRSLGSALQNVGRLLDRPIEWAVSADEIDTAIEAFEARFRHTLTTFEIHIEPLPAALVGVGALLQRDLRRRRPFGGHASAMRDALIWESILELCRREPRSLAVVTGNTREFADDPGNQLHQDLLEDLESIGIEREKVRFYRSIKAFNDAHLGNPIS